VIPGNVILQGGAAPHAPPGGAVAKGVAPRWTDASILIVDDEPSNRTVLTRLLHRSGYLHVQSAADGVSALQLYRERAPDLVLLDLRMPDIDGFDVLWQMKQATAADALVPVLVVSADPSIESKQRARSLGANDYLVKPYDVREVLLRVDALLELRGHTQQRFREICTLRTAIDRCLKDQAEVELHALDGLSAACALRDSLSEGHTARVGDVAAAIAGELGMGADTIEAIRRCAPLHDVGKLAVPDEILLKRGPLTLSEMAIAERHTTIGALILSGTRSPLLQLAAEIALTHHERWDGTGYPRGLRGCEIPLAGRIVAVADVFDALTHERPYKEAWPERRAIAAMIEERGGHFDPDAVDALVRVVLEAGRRTTRAA
jgi:putative two-component system response regulator